MKTPRPRLRGCEGLPINVEGWKRAIPYRPGEIDYEQPAVEMVRLTAETAGYLYSAYTPTETHYERGTRPRLERFVQVAVAGAKTDAERAARILERVWRQLIWPHPVPPRVREVGGTEEDILARGYAYCNEASRVFVTLAQVAGIPARMTFHWTPDGSAGHSLAEAFVDGKWQLADSDINLHGWCVPGLTVNCLDIMRGGEAAATFDGMVTREMLAVIGHVAPGAKYSDLFQVMGICNYPVEDFPYKLRVATSRGRYG
jgi:hypothetical protein